MANKKISQLTPKGSALAGTDLLEVSVFNGVTYDTKSLTGANVVSGLQPTLVSATNIKTINSTTLLGSGDLAVQPTLVSATNIKTINSTTLLGSGNLAVQPTLVSATNIKTINSTSLLGSGDLVISTGLTVGTTPITSGTIGRILFEGTGNVLQQDSTLFWDNTNKRLGVGATPSTSVRLDVRAQGALSTDIAFRVRNSADSGNLFTSLGSAQIIIGTSTTTPDGQILARHDFSSAQPILTLRNGQYGNLIFQVRDERTTSAATMGSFRINGIIDGGESGTTKRFDLGGHGLGASYGDNGNNAVWLNDQGNVGDGLGSTVISVSSNFYINRQTVKVFKFMPNVGNFGINVMTFGTSATNTFAVANGVAPATSPADAFQQYSADIVAGNAAPHFRTENGNIIKLYQQTTAVAAATVVSGSGGVVKHDDTFDGYTLEKVVKALRNIGLLA